MCHGCFPGCLATLEVAGAQVRGDHGEVVKLLVAAGAKVRSASGALIDLQTTQAARYAVESRFATTSQTIQNACQVHSVLREQVVCDVSRLTVRLWRCEQVCRVNGCCLLRRRP